MSGYLGLAAESPGVARRWSSGCAAIGPQLRDPMSPARRLFFGRISTQPWNKLARLDGSRWRWPAERRTWPPLALRVPLDDAHHLLDVGGGTGLYSIAWLQQHPHLRATVWDRPHVLSVAQEMAHEYGVADRLECVAGDMFADAVPEGAEVCLLSNILHDWDTADCRRLIGAVPLPCPVAAG